LAIRLVSEIEAAFGTKLRLRVLIGNATVGALARLIGALAQTCPALADSASIVLHNPGGSRKPLVFLHGDLFAEGWYCRRLAALMGGLQPIYAVAPHGTADLPLLPTVETMARDYVARIRAVQPHGPYRIAGFCASGLVAYELARQLRAEGQSVEKVVLVNAFALPDQSLPALDRLLRRIGLDARLAPRLRERLVNNIALSHRALVGGPRETFEFAARRARALFARKQTAPAEGVRPFGNQRGTRATENSFAHLVAALTYHPKPYDGEVTVIWGSEQDHTDWRDLSNFWPKVAEKVNVVPMSGGHIAPLNERLDELAAILGELLRDPAERPRAASGS
jgi:thioesterase domain-containing protein